MIEIDENHLKKVVIKEDPIEIYGVDSFFFFIYIYIHSILNDISCTPIELYFFSVVSSFI